MMKFMMITMRSRGIGTSSGGIVLIISSNFFFALTQSSIKAFAFSMSPLCRLSFNFSCALLNFSCALLYSSLAFSYSFVFS